MAIEYEKESGILSRCSTWSMPLSTDTCLLDLGQTVLAWESCVNSPTVSLAISARTNLIGLFSSTPSTHGYKANLVGLQPRNSNTPTPYWDSSQTPLRKTLEDISQLWWKTVRHSWAPLNQERRLQVGHGSFSTPAKTFVALWRMSKASFWKISGKISQASLTETIATH